MDITRFAPSPTGYLHVGNAFSALFAARHGQRFLLRIEDIDQQRCKPVYEKAMYDDLRWLGLVWEEPARRQSEHFGEYSKALNTLQERSLLYPCFCTRQDIARAGGAPQGDYGPLYPGTCRHLGASEVARRLEAQTPHALRLKVDEAALQTGPLYWHDRQQGKQQAQPEAHGDVVLARSLRGVNEELSVMPASYHLCVTHDDALQGITLVTRGMDLFGATHVHRLLQALLGYNVPEYLHHQLVTDESGERMAKRAGSATLQDLRAAGHTPESVIAGLPSL